MKKRAATPAPATENRLTVEQFAQLVGQSVKAVESWVVKGMPVGKAAPTGKRGRPRTMIDPETATAWMVANKLGNGTPTLHTTPVEVDPDQLCDELGLAGAIQRGEVLERLAGRIVRDAIVSRNSLAIRSSLENWRETGKALAELAKRHTERAVVEEEIHQLTQQAVREWCEPKRAFIDAIPHSYSTRLLKIEHLSDVEAVLRDLVTTLLKQFSEPLQLAKSKPDKPA
jgi:phage terminase Nu1 subunit (DNA packaging protein)